MDASSAYQDSLPVSSDALLKQLDDWGISYVLHRHVPLRTVEDAKSVEDQFMVPGEKALRLKNLYLRDKKKRNYLVTLEQDREIDLKAWARNWASATCPSVRQTGCWRTSVSGPAQSVRWHDQRCGEGVTFFMDAAAQEADVIYMHRWSMTARLR